MTSKAMNPLRGMNRSEEAKLPVTPLPGSVLANQHRAVRAASPKKPFP
jgi:hypothetical protein